jgi:hypothetical protein
MKWEAYVNNKLSFLFNRQEQKLEQIYMEMIANDCKLNREILRVKIGFSTVNIDSVIPLLPLQPGQFGRNVGEVMYVYQCTQVDVEMQPMRDKCYKELPVWHNNATRFLQPVTRLILPIEFVPINMTCSNVLQPIYRDINGRWIRFPEKTEAPEPLKFSLMELANHVKFKAVEVEAGGIYSEKDIQKAREHILFPVTRAQILSDMVSVAMQHYVPGGRPNYESLLSPDHFQRATKNMMKRMWGTREG